MLVINKPIYQESREALPAEHHEREDHSPQIEQNFFEQGSSVMSITTTGPGILKNGFVYINF